MLKLFNKKKKDNKGFTLVELVIVVAILAILVGILAPQYTKYVEKSRQAADVSNLENIVEAFKVAAADVDYDMIPATAATEFAITITKDGTTIKTDANAPSGTNGWAAALKEYSGYTFTSDNPNANLKIKSSKWVTDDKKVKGITAKVKIDTNGAVTVTYDPEAIKDVSNKKS